MAQTPKGRLVQGLYKPIYGTCAMYFYLGVKETRKVFQLLFPGDLVG